MSSAEPKVLWEPTAERIEQASLTRFARWVASARGLDVTGSYAELWQWSVDDVDGFWAAIWEFFAVDASAPYEAVLGARDMPGAEWFPGARLSYAEHVFRGKPDSALALQHASELRQLDWMTWGELRDMTARIATGLRFLGVEAGDRVVAYIPNIPEATAAFLACASIGARLIAFTSGRSRVLPASTNIVSAVAWASISAPAQLPTAAEAHNVAAVLRPRTLVPSFMMTPAPRKPMPETT